MRRLRVARRGQHIHRARDRVVGPRRLRHGLVGVDGGRHRVDPLHRRRVGNVAGVHLTVHGEERDQRVADDRAVDREAHLQVDEQVGAAPAMDDQAQVHRLARVRRRRVSPKLIALGVEILLGGQHGEGFRQLPRRAAGVAGRQVIRAGGELASRQRRQDVGAVDDLDVFQTRRADGQGEPLREVEAIEVQVRGHVAISLGRDDFAGLGLGGLDGEGILQATALAAGVGQLEAIVAGVQVGLDDGVELLGAHPGRVQQLRAVVAASAAPIEAQLRHRGEDELRAADDHVRVGVVEARVGRDGEGQRRVARGRLCPGLDHQLIGGLVGVWILRVVGQLQIVCSAGRRHKVHARGGAERRREVAGIAELDVGVGVVAGARCGDGVAHALRDLELHIVGVGHGNEAAHLRRAVGGDGPGLAAVVVRLVVVRAGHDRRLRIDAQVDHAHIVRLVALWDTLVRIGPGVEHVMTAGGSEGITGEFDVGGGPWWKIHHHKCCLRVWRRGSRRLIGRVDIEIDSPAGTFARPGVAHLDGDRDRLVDARTLRRHREIVQDQVGQRLARRPGGGSVRGRFSRYARAGAVRLAAKQDEARRQQNSEDQNENFRLFHLVPPIFV